MKIIKFGFDKIVVPILVLSILAYMWLGSFKAVILEQTHLPENQLGLGIAFIAFLLILYVMLLQTKRAQHKIKVDKDN